MRTMKYFKYIVFSLLFGASFISCQEEEDLGSAPRLFRPVTTLEVRNNNIIATWDNIKGATSYELTLHKSTGKKAEDGTELTEKYRETITVVSSPYTFEGVDWDEKYGLEIKSIGNNVASDVYKTSLMSVTYPTKLSEVRTTDIAVLVVWREGGNEITALNIVPEGEGEPILQSVASGEYASGKKIIEGLSPDKSYKVFAYSGEEQTDNTYEGRLSFKTKQSENFDERYGEGNYLDLRGENSKSILTSSNIVARMNDTEGLALILKGGFKYEINSSLKFQKSVSFVTGLSLEGNAIIVQDAAMQTEVDATVAKIAFEGIDLISSTAAATPVSEATGTSSSAWSKQVYNVPNSATNSNVGEMNFKNCRIEGYRSVIRLQTNSNEMIGKVSFDGCTINGVGEQGFFHIRETLGNINEIEIKNSTLTNICVLVDARKTATNQLSLTISDCTFCYAPIETIAGATTPLLRFATTALNLSVTNTIFGPSMATQNGDGINIITYTAGTRGSIFLNATTALVGVTNSFKTNFGWTEIGGKTYPLDNLDPSLTISETGLFTDPAKGNFKIKYSSFEGAKTAGALQWRME
jgi:hypothetical protein